ncbi:hypothetical protein FA15DRAFT_682267 [Coprinopsis marcescibilis]|uniref:Uncharacterized protein n=1 Tax=Coprinopsis marcescibilis TaxID=230819 RepID=A0A5C3KYH9_COPMA|nr:hypothetical protein FA15DRAFT_682267 [Coprinopsis marcescibilis]
MSAPTEFFLQLQKGIVGGFAPPTIDAVYSLTRSGDSPNHLVVNAAVRPPGTPHVEQSAAPKNLDATNAHTTSLVDELYSILKELPLEVPTGSEDIYGLDTSIRFGSASLEWANGGPQSCGGGESKVKATPEQKEKFKRAVAIVHELVDKES